MRMMERMRQGGRHRQSSNSQKGKEEEKDGF